MWRTSRLAQPQLVTRCIDGSLKGIASDHTAVGALISDEDLGQAHRDQQQVHIGHEARGTQNDLDVVVLYVERAAEQQRRLVGVKLLRL